MFAVYLSNNHHHGAENSRDTGGERGGGWAGRPRQQGVMGRGWWVAWARGGGGGVNIVMISPEFSSSGPMRRERDREGEMGGWGGQLPSCHHRQT